MRALEIGAGLKNRRFERYTFRFSKLPEVLAAINAPLFLANCRQNIDGTEVGSWVPFLTLRSPLKENKVRRMNLFEPRWLAMLLLLLFLQNFPSPELSNTVTILRKFLIKLRMPVPVVDAHMTRPTNSDHLGFKPLSGGVSNLNALIHLHLSPRHIHF